AVDRNPSAAPFDNAIAGEMLHAHPKNLQRGGGIEAPRISGHADVRRMAVSRDPRDVSRCDARIEKAVQRRLASRSDDDFQADEKINISIEAELPRHDRSCAVSADHEADLEVFNPVGASDGDVSWHALHDARTRQPVHAGPA